MSAVEASTRVRISKIAGRYLVFDSDGAAFLRRNASLNGTLVGTAPQQPTQNIFLGLPIELRPEEADALVQQKVAYLVDDVAAHQAVLHNPDPETRKAYLDSLKTRKQTAQKVFAEKNAKRAADQAERRTVTDPHRTQARRNVLDPDEGLFSSSQTQSQKGQSDTPVKSLGVTPTSSGPLISTEAERIYGVENPPKGPLCQFLLSSGYYMTPGLRFGAQYSVYPGDPLRFHAHFMASEYNWDEEIPILDIVAGGRLATAVKKSFLLGGQQRGLGASHNTRVRTFSVEWAGM
ncbi:Fc.00g085950.m01.CDS01 [Cosmosporella sp. VM-42]